MLNAEPVSPYAQRMSANGVNEDPRRESVWVAHNNMKLLNFFSSFIALLLIGFMKQSLADLFIFAPCGRPLQASQGAVAIQSIKAFSYSSTLKHISKYAFWSIDHLIECDFIRKLMNNNYLQTTSTNLQ